MSKSSRFLSFFLSLFLVLIAGIEPTLSAEDVALSRARHQIEMLDDLYKTVIVLVTDRYVTDPSKYSGASAAKDLFATMKKNGWHDVRLIGLTDILNNPAVNAPKDDFEKTAKAKLSEGAPTYEELITIDGKRYLRKATPIPVVHERCAMCHVNFKDNQGIIGALSYTVPIVE